jgi:glycosyltransferase involved in cell wall biosynthesis
MAIPVSENANGCRELRPEISVLICTFNRSQSLARTLESLEAMGVPRDLLWELIVIDNNSKDATGDIVNCFLTRNTALPLKYFFEPSPGLSYARNRGIRESQGAILAFLDDDVLVSPNWLEQVQRAFETYDPSCMGGRVLLDESNIRPAWWDNRYNGAAGEFDRGTVVIVPDNYDDAVIGIGANISFKRSSFDQYGLFRTDLGRRPDRLGMGEETEMVQRLRQQKKRVIYYPDALVFHCPPGTRFSKPYLRRHFYNLGKWYFVRDRESDIGPRIFGVPRWAYRSIVMRLMKSIVLVLRARWRESFFEQLEFLTLMGYFSVAPRSANAKARAKSQP